MLLKYIIFLNESLNQSKKELKWDKTEIQGKYLKKNQESHTNTPRFNLPRTCKMSIFVLTKNKKGSGAPSQLPIFSHLLAKCQSYKTKNHREKLFFCNIDDFWVIVCHKGYVLWFKKYRCNKIISWCYACSHQYTTDT